MERISVSLDEDLVQQFEAYRKANGYQNRSEAVRDLIRDKLESERETEEGVHCVGTLSYVYNHEERELARRLTQAHHHHHDLSISTLHVHLDHDNCLETVILKGPIEEVKAFSKAVIAQPGVRHGSLNIIPVSIERETHHHGGDVVTHEHTRLKT